MSALLSTTVCCLFSLCYVGDNALKVGSFWHGRQNWMVFRLAPNLNQAEAAVGVNRSRGQHFKEVGRADVVGTGAGHQDATGAQHLEGAEVELLVAAQGRLEVALGLGESRRVENDCVVAAVG